MGGNWNSGRRKQPTALTVLRGNPGKRRLAPETEPAFAALDASWDRPPAELAGDTRARREWRRLVPLLRDCGVVTQGDRAALVALCLEWSAYLEARAFLRRASRSEKGRPASVDVPGRTQVADRALSQCHRLWHELGLTPAGRAKVARVPAARTPPASKWGGLV